MTTTLDTIRAQLDDILSILSGKIANVTISGSQVVTPNGLSDIDSRLGLVQAGEFRSGNGKLPGDGFTGGRFGYPGFTYGGADYFLVGVKNDVLQVGLSLTDGNIVAGAGTVRITSSGIVILESPDENTSFLSFYDSTGVTQEFGIYSLDGALVTVSRIAGYALTWTIMLTDTSTPYINWLEHPSTPNLSLLQINAGPEATQVEVGGGDIVLSARQAGTVTMFNSSAIDTDFIVRGSSNNNFFILDASSNTMSVSGTVLLEDGEVIINSALGDYDFKVSGTSFTVLAVDAGLNRVEIKNSGGAAVHIFNPAGDSYINEPNSDIDFFIETVNNPKALHMDAGFDTALSLAWNGWFSREYETWTRTGNHTFTISGDVTATYRKGTKVKYNDGAADFGVVGSSSYSGPGTNLTTVNLIPNTDYVMAAVTITGHYVSYVENPAGFPQWFNWDANPQGFSSVPTSQAYRWATYGNTIFIAYIELTNGVSNATTFTASAPINPAQAVTGVAGTLVDNGALLTVAGRVTMTAGSTTITFRTDMSVGAWTNVNGKRAVAYWNYEF